MKTCVRCGVAFVLTTVPCPDGPTRQGNSYVSCLVLHYGERCPKCGGAVYERCA